MKITQLPTNWRNKYKQAQFRWAIFFVENDARAGGRRVAVHQYPKRNVPYAEDMGRSAVRFTVQGYLIGKMTGQRRNPPGRFGPDDENVAFGGPPQLGAANEEVSYLDLKDNLIECLEQDGPGVLQLPLPYKMQTIKVMVQAYTITESRERGGICTVDMDFIEYGDPTYRSTVSTPAEIEKSAGGMEKAVEGEITKATADIVGVYDKAYSEALKFIENFGPR
jgi:prophage DNA circulation protein